MLKWTRYRDMSDVVALPDDLTAGLFNLVQDGFLASDFTKKRIVELSESIGKPQPLPLQVLRRAFPSSWLRQPVWQLSQYDAPYH